MAEVKPFVWGSSGVELLQSGDSLSGVGSGAMELIQSVTISSPVASVEFTKLSSDYYKYTIEYLRLRSEDINGVALLCHVQVDGAWITDTYTGVSVTAHSAYTGTVSDNAIVSISTGLVKSNKNCYGNLTIYDPSDDLRAKTIRCNVFDPSAYLHYEKVFYYCGASINLPVTGLRFTLSSGNMTSGVFKLYGAKV